MVNKEVTYADLSQLKDFLHCETPASWIEKALADIPTLLIDHAHCERKAASTAYRYCTVIFSILMCVIGYHASREKR